MACGYKLKTNRGTFTLEDMESAIAQVNNENYL